MDDRVFEKTCALYFETTQRARNDGDVHWPGYPSKRNPHAREMTEMKQEDKANILYIRDLVRRVLDANREAKK